MSTFVEENENFFVYLSFGIEVIDDVEDSTVDSFELCACSSLTCSSFDDSSSICFLKLVFLIYIIDIPL